MYLRIYTINIHMPFTVVKMNHFINESFDMARIRLWSHFVSFFSVRNTYGDYVTTVSCNETPTPSIFTFFNVSDIWLLISSLLLKKYIENKLYLFCVITPKLSPIGLNRTLCVCYKLKHFSSKPNETVLMQLVHHLWPLV